MRYVLLSLGILMAATVGCSSERSASPEKETAGDSAQVVVQTFEGKGIVRSIMPNKKYLTIAHDDIPGFMSAMEMPFALKDTGLATGVAAGDSVRFIVEVDGPYIHVVQIDVSG